MDEEQAYERFDANNDYEGGQWIGGEYFYSTRRQKHAQTKDDQLYGVFNDSDSDGGGAGRKRKRKPEADYTRPVAFKSSGTAQGSTDKPEDVLEAEHQAAVPSATTGLGLKPGLGASAAGLGPNATPGLGSTGGLGARSAPSQSAGIGFAPAKSQAANGLAGDGEDADDEPIMPTSFGKRILQTAAQKAKADEERRRKEVLRTRAQASGVQPDVGRFEAHTKGFGAKMLERMGYVSGQGLGSKGQGIAKPIEAKMRQRGAGLGHGQREEPRMAGPELPAPGQEQAAAKAPQPKAWKRKNARQRQDFKTMADVLQDSDKGPGAPPPAPRTQTIIDMRGRQARLVTNLEHLNVEEQDATGDLTPMPELQHNMQLLVDLAEADIQRLDARLRQEQDTAVVLAREEERLRGEVQAAAAAAQHVGAVLQQVQLVQARPSASLAELHAAFAGLQASHREEYVMYGLAAAALALALPRFQQLAADWAPLQQPGGVVAAELLRWRPLLESESARQAIFQDVSAGSEDPYMQLLCTMMLSRLQSAVTNEWEPRNAEPMVQFVEQWAAIMPQALQRHVLDSLVFPKLARAVDAWEPRTERVPLHAWLHPWLPWLGDRMEDLYPGIRGRLAAALQQWHPSDASALALLTPWHKVFDPKDWDALVMRSIVPKLAWALESALEINPLQQDLAPWHWVLGWQEVLPVHHLVNLLEFRFFPRWHGVLQHWLAGTPNFDEVTQWYLGWKSLLPGDLADQERIRAQLTAGLNAMNAAADGRLPAWQRGAAAAAAAAAPPPSAAEQRMPASFMAAGEAAADALTLRQLVEAFAVEHDVQLLPKAGQMHEGLQVYGFGLVSIVMDNVADRIRARLGGGWTPVSLEQLVAENAKRAAAGKR